MILVTNKVFTIDEMDDINNGDKLIEKYEKLSKIRKLLKNLKMSKFKNLKSEKLSRS